ncbi:hypothetical protein PWT90_04222 [Aphanocladium album]|nr:hypothetical protein PWT90_04222 [Aphanocladium album]
MAASQVASRKQLAIPNKPIFNYQDIASMTISEIGLLRLKSTASLEDLNIQKRLDEIKSYLEDFTGHEFYYFRQAEDLSLLYLLGQWESLESHYKGMHSADQWKNIVMELSNYFEFQWMAHYDFLLEGLRLDDGILEVHRFFMKTPSRDEFDKELKARLPKAGYHRHLIRKFV